MKLTNTMVEAALDKYYGCKKNETWRSIFRPAQLESEMADMRRALKAAITAADEQEPV